MTCVSIYRVGSALDASTLRPVSCMRCGQEIGRVRVIGELSRLDAAFVGAVFSDLRHEVERHESECRSESRPSPP